MIDNVLPQEVFLQPKNKEYFNCYDNLENTYWKLFFYRDKTSMSGWHNDGMGKKKLNLIDTQNNWTILIFHFLYMQCFQKDKKAH